MNTDTVSIKVFKVVNIAFLIIISAIMVFPYINVLANALNDGLDAARGGITLYPRVPTFENFRVLLSNSNIAKAAGISVSRLLLGTAFALIVQFSCAYVFTKKTLKWKNVLLIYLMIPMYFGGGLIPVYILYAKIHLLNNFLVYVLPVSFSLYNMVIIRTYLYTIPESLEESAKLDGANDMVVMLRIILPLSKPILATVGLWTAVSHWNDWTTTLYFVPTNSGLYTLQYILMKVLKESESITKLMQEASQNNLSISTNARKTVTPDTVKAAQIIITSLPIILVYPFLQKYFIKGVTLGAVKE